MASFGVALGPFAGPLAPFGCPWAPFGSLWGALGLPLAPSGVALAPFGLPLGSLWGALGSLWVPLARFGSFGCPWALFGSSMFTVCDACRQNQASWNTPPEPTGATGAAEVVSRTAAGSPPPTRAGGQDDGSYTNSLKSTAKSAPRLPAISLSHVVWSYRYKYT